MIEERPIAAVNVTRVSEPGLNSNGAVLVFLLTQGFPTFRSATLQDKSEKLENTFILNFFLEVVSRPPEVASRPPGWLNGFKWLSFNEP